MNRKTLTAALLALGASTVGVTTATAMPGGGPCDKPMTPTSTCLYGRVKGTDNKSVGEGMVYVSRIVSGQVTDSEEVEFGVDGAWEMGGLQPGDYVVTFKPFDDAYYPEMYRNFYDGDGHQADARIIHLGAGKKIRLNAALMRTSRIEGTVRDAKGQPLADVRVLLSWKHTQNSWLVTTDAAGHYMFPNIPRGQFRILFNYQPKPANACYATKYGHLITIAHPKHVVKNAKLGSTC